MHTKFTSTLVTILLSIALASTVGGAPPSTQYKIHINPADLSGFNVEMWVPAVSARAQIAMAVHPEYDDRYWRYIENFSASDARGRTLRFSKEEDTVWRIENTRGGIVVRYRLRLPPQQGTHRDAWKPFLTAHGGMVGDLHSLMYVVGGESRRARLTLFMPADWNAAAGLEPTRDPRTFTGSTELILDAPIMVGNLRKFDFQAGGVPHEVVFWSAPDGPAFDAEAIVNGVRKLSEEAIRAFGKPPYPRYAFLFQNGGLAALEHLTSSNFGLSSNLEEMFDEIAHEYIHVWNLMDVRPRERIGVRFRFAEPTGVLWWSEGATIMFADLLIRRAGLPGESRTRLKRLEFSIARYMTAPGYYTMSAEHVSRGDSHPLILGDSFASTHLQGEVLSTMLDFKIRDATDGRRTAADVMRLLSSRFDFQHGIGNSAIESAAAQVCGCDVRQFFQEYIYNAKQIDFNHYLGLIGVRAAIGSIPAVNDNGTAAVDLRIGPISSEPTPGGLKIRISNPQSTWARAGLHTGDIVTSIDGSPVAAWRDLRQWLQRAKIGDRARMVISREGRIQEVIVPITGYNVATVELTERPDATSKQTRLRDAWNRAN